MCIVDSQIEELLQMRCIEEIQHHIKTGWVSPIFLVPKKSSGHQMICHLKLMNAHIVYTRFTLSGIEKVLDMIWPGDFFGSLDLVTAYGHAYIDSRHQKIFQFQWHQRHFKYVSLPQGLWG